MWSEPSVVVKGCKDDRQITGVSRLSLQWVAILEEIAAEVEFENIAIINKLRNV